MKSHGIFRVLRQAAPLCLLVVRAAFAQADSTSHQQNGILQDDPSNIFTRIELFNEYQTSTGGDVVNVTTMRGIMAIGKRFTTRIENEQSVFHVFQILYKLTQM